jgi:hypothetical protein
MGGDAVIFKHGRMTCPEADREIERLRAKSERIERLVRDLLAWASDEDPSHKTPAMAPVRLGYHLNALRSALAPAAPSSAAPPTTVEPKAHGEGCEAEHGMCHECGDSGLILAWPGAVASFKDCPSCAGTGRAR